MKYRRVVLGLTFLVLLFWHSHAQAQTLDESAFFVDGDGVFTFGRERLIYAYNQARTIIYVIAGIGALALGIQAFFGKFAWGRFFAMLGGLLMIALITEGISFVIGANARPAFESPDALVGGGPDSW